MAAQNVFAITAFEDRFSRLFLKYPRFCRVLGNLETKLFQSGIRQQVIDRPIFISGLARSGSTIVLECLAAHEQTASHRYRDYPLVFIPLWWDRLVGRAAPDKQSPVERFHQDGLLITPDSPEAMEEILWMMFFKSLHRPSRPNVLGADENHPDFEAFYGEHIRKILYLRQGSRYLAKNNYLVTRLAYVRKFFPDARFIIPIRNPVHHIASLMRQHRRFCEQERRNPRISNYMRNAGHFEFGLDRRPVNTGDMAAADRIAALWRAGKEIQGWAVLWRSVYGHVLNLLSLNRELRAAAMIVDYDDFCGQPEKTLQRIYDHCGLPVGQRFLEDQSKRIFPVRDGLPSAFGRPETTAIDAQTREMYENLLGLIQ